VPEPASSAEDALPQHCQVIEISVAELRQLFNAIDPSPFRQRDLDPRAEEFIVGWATDLPVNKPWALLVHLDRPAGRADEAAVLRESIHEYFGQRVVASSRKLRELFHRGRISLAIALAFLTASIVVGDAVARYLGESRLSEVIREGFLIGGWVAMWRPLEVFLYDWWPIRAEGRLLKRLSTMPVRIEYKETAHRDAWRSDWPEVPARERPRETLEPPARNTVMDVERTMESESTQHQHTPEEERRILRSRARQDYRRFISGERSSIIEPQSRQPFSHSASASQGCRSRTPQPLERRESATQSSSPLALLLRRVAP
jgi:hypothetical protein